MRVLIAPVEEPTLYESPKDVSYAEMNRTTTKKAGILLIQQTHKSVNCVKVAFSCQCCVNGGLFFSPLCF